MKSNAWLINQKIFELQDHDALLRRIHYWRFFNRKVVFTNGCFDIMHRGHVDYLSKAAELGDILVVGLNTDSSVARLKGPSRPVNDQQARAAMLASLFFVDSVVLFDQDTPYQLIKTIQPDVLVKGSDYAPEDIVGYDVVKAKKGEVITIDFLDGYSTSGLISKLKSI